MVGWPKTEPDRKAVATPFRPGAVGCVFTRHRIQSCRI